MCKIKINLLFSLNINKILLSLLFFVKHTNMMRFFILIFFSLFCFTAYVFGQNKDTLINTDIPVIAITDEDLSQDNGTDESISSLLQASKDIFVSTAGYTFGPTRFRIRGYDSKNSSVTMNGILMNDVETGRTYWSRWGGLNNAIRNKEILFGLQATPYIFAGVGGLTNIDTRASHFRKGTYLTYSLANVSYRQRIMASYATGMLDNGWAFSFSGSRRWANEGYVEGTFYDAFGYFFAAEKKINDKHSMNLTVFGAPTIKGRSSISTQEVYDLTNNSYYNSYWGYQNGVKRNARISNYHQPSILLNHYWKIKDNLKLTSGIGYTFGRGGSTALNWYDATHPSEIGNYLTDIDLGYNDPRPDYYRYLPSYYAETNTDMYYQLTNLWETDESIRQLNWDYFYFANKKNLFTVNNSDGISGNNITGNRSKYIVEERRNDQNRLDFTSVLKHTINDHIELTGGINAVIYKGAHYKVINDLLGGDFWVDIDQFAERDYSDEFIIQNDTAHPNRIVKTGERFGYDYIANVNKYSDWLQSTFTYNKVDFYAGLQTSYTQFWRTGNMTNGKFPNNSGGESEKQNFFNYGTKLGLTYKITGRHYLSFNSAYITKAPDFRDAYISPRTRDFVVNNLSSEEIITGDINYYLRFTRLKARITAYYTEFKNQIYNRSFYHDELRTFVNYAMSGVNKLNTGIETGIEANVTPTITLSGVVSKGDYIYNSRPKVTITQDNSADLLAEDRIVYLKNYKVGGFPQTAASIGFKYRAPKFWFVGVNANYFDDIYIDINPDRRTAEAMQGSDADMQGIITTDPQWDEILKQEQLDPGFTLNLYGGKSWKLKGYYIYLNVSINNILNNTDLATGGFEQLRFDRNNINKFPSKYFYLYGRTYFINLSCRF